MFSVKNETIHFFEEMMANNLEGKNCPKFKADATSDQIVSNETFKDQNFVFIFIQKTQPLDALLRAGI